MSSPRRRKAAAAKPSPAVAAQERDYLLNGVWGTSTAPVNRQAVRAMSTRELYVPGSDFDQDARPIPWSELPANVVAAFDHDLQTVANILDTHSVRPAVSSSSSSSSSSSADAAEPAGAARRRSRIRGSAAAGGTGGGAPRRRQLRGAEHARHTELERAALVDQLDAVRREVSLRAPQAPPLGEPREHGGQILPPDPLEAPLAGLDAIDAALVVDGDGLYARIEAVLQPKELAARTASAGPRLAASSPTAILDAIEHSGLLRFDRLAVGGSAPHTPHAGGGPQITSIVLPVDDVLGVYCAVDLAVIGGPQQQQAAPAATQRPRGGLSSMAAAAARGAALLRGQPSAAAAAASVSYELIGHRYFMCPKCDEKIFGSQQAATAVDPK